MLVEEQLVIKADRTVNVTGWKVRLAQLPADGTVKVAAETARAALRN